MTSAGLVGRGGAPSDEPCRGGFQDPGRVSAWSRTARICSVRRRRTPGLASISSSRARWSVWIFRSTALRRLFATMSLWPTRRSAPNGARRLHHAEARASSLPQSRGRSGARGTTSEPCPRAPSGRMAQSRHGTDGHQQCRHWRAAGDADRTEVPRTASTARQSAEADGRELQPRGRPCSGRAVIASRAPAAESSSGGRHTEHEE